VQKFQSVQNIKSVGENSSTKHSVSREIPVQNFQSVQNIQSVGENSSTKHSVSREIPVQNFQSVQNIKSVGENSSTKYSASRKIPVQNFQSVQNIKSVGRIPAQNIQSAGRFHCKIFSRYLHAVRLMRVRHVELALAADALTAETKYPVSRNISVQHTQSVGIFQYKLFSQ
jgi:hypothetical protein